MPIDVLCVLEPGELGLELQRRLAPSRVTVAASGKQARALLRDRPAELVVAATELLPRPFDAWVRRIRELPGSPDVVLVHGGEDPQLRAALIRAGCLALLSPTLPADDLVQTLQALVQRRVNQARRVHATSPLGRSRLQDFVSHSAAMHEFLAVARRLVDTDSSLLVLGETGTGKERLARALHEESRRSGGPFVAVNCGAFPDTLLESELFGHEKGAFTGAAQARKGYFEQSEGGTLFLDEIGEVPLHLQVKLLRVLEERRVRRLGAESSFVLDCRIVAATNRDLEQEVAAGRFRRDLYYRLAVVTLTLPPLRERREDIQALFESYVEHFRTTLNRTVFGVQQAAIEALLRYAWPGNVRELINVVERAVLLSPGPEIGLADLPRAISSLAPGGAAIAGGAPPAPGPPRPDWMERRLREARREVLAEFERAYLTHHLRATGGRIGETARRAGLSQRSLFDLMRRHQLWKEDFRGGRADEGP